MAEEIKQAKADGVVTASSNYISEVLGEGGEVSVDFSIPGTTEEMVEAYGEKVVQTNAAGNIVISLQSNIRRWFKQFIEEAKSKGEEPDLDKLAAFLQGKADSWKPGVVQRTKKSQADKVLDQAAKIEDPTALAELIKKLQAQAAGK